MDLPRPNGLVTLIGRDTNESESFRIERTRLQLAQQHGL